MARHIRNKKNLLVYLAEVLIQENRLNKSIGRKYKYLINPTENTNIAEKSYKENFSQYENTPASTSDNEMGDPYSTNSESRTYKRQYVCHEYGCDKSYTSNHGLQYHKKHGHNSKDESTKPYKCPHKSCGRAYKNVNGLKYHMRVEHDEI
ncbi:Zinc finger C2H2 protein [Cucumispora dikerogammari]|nr:Zinc finger C2H2 protein [Cucumispora dikerogammari]